MRIRLAPLAILGLSALLLARPSTSLAATGSLQFSSLAFSVKESGASAKIIVNRLSGSSGTVTVDFATVDSGGGNATPMLDYISTNGTLTFGPGVTTRYFYVPILKDTAHEGNETVVIELSNPSEGATLAGQPNTTLTILDNDACTYELNPAARTHDEVGGLASLEVLAPDGCEWTAESTAAWIGIFGGTAGSGNGTVSYTYDPLPGDIMSRTGTIRIGGKIFTLTQMVPPADLTPPTITFLTPLAGSRQTNQSILVTGRASDQSGVMSVEFRLENSAGTTAFSPATGIDNWSATVHGLQAGTNVIRVRVQDISGNIQESSRDVFFVEVSPITLTTQGNGTVSGLKNGQVLDVGKSYTVQAKAASGHFFSGWSGSLESAENPLSFEMSSNLVLQANFISSPFTAVAGAYAGLLYETGMTRHASSGLINLTVGSLGTFSAKLTVGGVRSACSGRFDLAGKATNLVPRRDATNLTLSLELDLISGSDTIVGSVDHGDWQSALTAYRDIWDTRTNPAPQAGRYTVIIPGDVDHTDTEPGGDGFGTIQVTPDGTAKLTGTLADGTKVSAKIALSPNGLLPLYVPLYAGLGSINGWVTFQDVPNTSDLDGPVTWFKPTSTTAKYYRDGFAIQPALTGSRYFVPTNQMGRVLSLTDGRIAFAGGNLTATFENAVALSALGVVTNLGANKMSASIQKSTGLLTGSVNGPGAPRSTAFRGAIHQKGNFASGFFLGTNQTGRAHLSE